MPITERQREERRKFVGSSDVPAIMGLSSFKSAYDVWLEKLNKVEDGPPSEAADLGTRFEPVLLDWASERLGTLVKNQTRRVRVPDTPLVSHVDAIVKATGDPVEAKTSGILGPLKEEWGDEGTDQVPDYAWVQCQVHIAATGRPWCHLPAMLGGRGFRLFLVPKNEEVIKEVIEAARHFWLEHVLTKTPPEDSLPTLDMAKRIRRLPEKVVAIDPVLIEAWDRAKDALRQAEEAEARAKAAILAALGDAEGSEETPLGTITYMEQTRKTIDEKALREGALDVYERFVKESRFRVLRLRAPKKAARKES